MLLKYWQTRENEKRYLYYFFRFDDFSDHNEHGVLWKWREIRKGRIVCMEWERNICIGSFDWEKLISRDKRINGADIDVNKEIKYVNIVKNLALVVFEKDNLNNGKVQFLVYSVDGRFLRGYQITPVSYTHLTLPTILRV